MKISEAGLRFLMDREGFRNDAYVDPATGGEPITIGVGHTDPGKIKLGMRWTDAEVMDALRSDVAKFERSVNAAVKVPLTQHQFDALVDFAFNEGEFALAYGGAHGSQSTLLRLLNAGDYVGADHEFIKWNVANGHMMGGLTTRRKLEAEMFLAP